MFAIRIKIDAEPAKRMLDRAPGLLRAALDRAATLVLALVERLVTENIRTPYEGKPPAVGYGFLVNSVFAEISPEPLIGGTIAVHPPADVYAAPVEYGSRAHFPPVAALVPWVKRKFGIKDEAEAEAAAFAVARGIAARGTPAHRMFTRAAAQAEPEAQAIFDREIDAALQEMEGGR